MKKIPAILPANASELTAHLSARSWSTPQVGLLLSSLFLLYLLASFTGLFFREEHIPWVQIAVTLFMYTWVIVLITGINRRQGGTWLNTYGMGLVYLKKIALAPLFYLVLMPPLLVLTQVWHGVLHKVFGITIQLQDVSHIFMQEFSGLQLLYILMAVLIAPLFEEILFRGVVFPYLVQRIGLVKGAFIVSAWFAVMHFHLPALAPLLLLSAALCYAYWRTRSLWVSIGLHALFNSVTIFALHVTP